MRPQATLRAAAEADIPALHRIRLSVRENRLSDPSRVTERDYVEHLATLGRGWVVEVDGAIVGFAIGRVTDGNIWALFVDPAHEGKGYGSMLHDAMVAGLREAGVSSPWLSTEPGTRAEAFYRRKGWVPHPPHPPGEVRMSLPLPGASPVRGSQGYAAYASELIARYETIGFAEKHPALMPSIPAECSVVLDVGAGAGGDAAWLAERGHRVVAVEPVAEFREYASQRHSSPNIEWIDDCLPRLGAVVQRSQAFDLIIVSAVWMHLDRAERGIAMPVLASLLSPGGVLYITLRHGPTPKGRVMFDVHPDETIADARLWGLDVESTCLGRESVQSANREAGVTWSHLVLMKPRAR